MPDTSGPTVLVLGANGRFGLAAAQAFDAAGWQVIASVRRAAAPGMPARARLVTAAVEDTATLAREAAGAQVLVHALNPPYDRWPRQLMPMSRAGMDLAKRLGARFMLPGNVYNYGESMPALLTPDAPQATTTRKGRLRIQLEDELQQRCIDGRLRATIIRAGDYFGGGTGSWLDLVIVKSLRDGKLVYPGPTDVPHAWAYLPDLARAFVAAAARPGSGGAAFERFHFPGHTITGGELLRGLEQAAESLGVRPARPWKHGSVPWPLLRLGGLFVPMLREISEMSYLWRVPHELDGHALEQAIGPVTVTPLDDALRQALVDLGYGSATARDGGR
jgi:nucleoside-diphosphate-sugar epimerase